MSCPFDCEYCFIEDINPNQQRGVAYLSQKQFELIKQLPKEINLVMLGCDTEFFQSKQNSLEILEKLVVLNKDISVITKLSLPQDFIQQLNNIDNELNQHGNFLTFSESITCIDSAWMWEPKVPSSDKRIETLKDVHQQNIKTLVAIRPLLPTISNKELEMIVSLTKNYCYGYYSGPLYLKNLEHKLIDLNQQNLKIEKLQPHWMPSDNIFYKIEKEGQLDVLKNILEKHNKPLFEGAADAIKHIKNL